jgi:hypothetical protein
MRVSAREAARRLGVSHPAILKAIKRGKISRRKDGLIEMSQFPREARRALVDRLAGDFAALLRMDVAAAGDALAAMQKSLEASK